MAQAQREDFYDGDFGDPTPQTPAPAPASSPAPIPQPSSPIPVESPTAAIVAQPPPVPTPRRAPTVLPVPAVAAAPRYQASDYAAAARALLPRGRAWPDDPASVQGQVLGALARTFERSDAAASMLLSASIPGRLTPLLPEWEASLGLPDPCAGAAPTFQQRVDQVRARFVGGGGQSRQRYVDLAAALGFTIAITNYAPFRAGLSGAGSPAASDAWTFVWGVRILSNTGSLTPDVLMCELAAIKPAETTVILLS